MIVNLVLAVVSFLPGLKLVMQLIEKISYFYTGISI